MPMFLTLISFYALFEVQYFKMSFGEDKMKKKISWISIPFAFCKISYKLFTNIRNGNFC
jgi:hypothetical protein